MSKFVLAVLSEVSIEKTHRMKELNAALARELFTGITTVLPLMVGDDEAAPDSYKCAYIS